MFLRAKKIFFVGIFIIEPLFGFNNKYPLVHYTPQSIQAEKSVQGQPNIVQEKMYFCTAADEESFSNLVNLIGSIHASNFNALGEIAVFDLGLLWDQRILLEKMQKVCLYTIEMANPDMLQYVAAGYEKLYGAFFDVMVRGWYAWRPVVIKQALSMFPSILYVDSCCTILKPLDEIFAYVRHAGSLLFKDPCKKYGTLLTIKDRSTQRIVDFYNLAAPEKSSLLNELLVSSRVQGVDKKLYESYIMPVYEQIKDLRNVQDDGSCLAGFGFGGHDQILLTMQAYALKLNLLDLNKHVTLKIQDKSITCLISDDQKADAHIACSNSDKKAFTQRIKFNDASDDGKPIETLLACIRPSEEKEIVVVIPSYNNKDWYKKNLDSVFTQHYTNYHVIYIDDASPDGTGALVEAYLKEKKQAHRVMLIQNKERLGALANFYYAINSCADHKIIVTLDGDDWFAHDNVLLTINKAYADSNIWLTYGQYQRYPSQELGPCRPFPHYVVATNTFREYRNYFALQLRTFYAWLFKKITLNDLLIDGNFFPMTGDVAMMMPMLEMAGYHGKCIFEVLYIYNRVTALNDDKVNDDLQWYCDCAIRARSKYQRLLEVKK